MGSPETSVSNHLTPRNNTEDEESQLFSIFNLGARWECVVNATPRPFYPPKNPVSSV